MDWTSGAFWSALSSIALANVVLSADNAIVIAAAAAGLPEAHRQRAVFWGTTAAVLLRIALTAVAAQALQWPGLRLAAAAFLVYIAIGVQGMPGSGRARAATTLHGAIRTILIADVVMSLDNVVALVALADGNWVLLGLGLMSSLPLILGASAVLLGPLRRWPAIAIAGAAMLGFIAGEMAGKDLLVVHWLGPIAPETARAAGVSGALLVFLAGRFGRRRR